MLFFLAILVVVAASTVFYKVDPEEVGVVMRFGKHVATSPPGLHFKLPFPVDEVIHVPTQRQLTGEFGFRTQKAGVRTQFTNKGYEAESSMLTGDLNTAVVEWVIQYRIVDPVKFLFTVRNPIPTFSDMSEAVMREVVGDRTVNEVLTVGRQEVGSVVHQKLQALCEQYEIGLQVEQVLLQDVTPPDPVKPAFNEVNQAEQEKEKLINEAQSEYNKVVPRAKGEAQQTILAAEGYATDRVNRAEGEANRFESLYTEYRKSPEVTRKRIYLETMGEVLPRSGRKIVVDDSVRGVLPLLNLDAARARPRQQPASDGGAG
nr:protein HflK-like [Nerophis lumbriciformis]